VVTLIFLNRYSANRAPAPAAIRDGVFDPTVLDAVDATFDPSTPVNSPHLPKKKFMKQ
jgi:hypothetical protein